jgi:hypothetical protein
MCLPVDSYATLIMAMTGIAMISVRIIHHLAFASLRAFLLAPVMAANIAASPLTKAIINASNPRLRHPGLYPDKTLIQI